MKILLITDSTGNPRSSNIQIQNSKKINRNEIYNLEDTFCYLLNKKLTEHTFHQISFGGISTKKLISQAMSYFKDWKPEIIICHTGINDCKPSVFSEIQNNFLSRNPYLFKYLKLIIYNPILIKFFNKRSSNKYKFLRDIKIFNNIFKDSKIFWLKISCHDKLENSFPGVLKNKNEFNKILENIYSSNFIDIEKPLKIDNGFLEDGLHYNVQGHKIIFSEIIKSLRI